MNGAVAHWGRGALLVLLVAAFLQPACMTTMLWRDDWPEHVTESTDARTTVRRPPPTGRDDDAHAFFVAVDDALRTSLPADARESAWLKLVPREHAYTVAMLLAAHSVDGFLLQVEFTAAPDGALTASLSCWLQASPGLPDAMLRELPGFEFHWSLYSSYRFATACTWEPVRQGQPVPLGWETELGRKCIQELPEMTAGRSVTARVLCTPLTVLGDVLLSPFELLAWLRP